MKKLLLCCFLILTSPVFAQDLPSNPRNDTPAQALKRLQNSFKSQANYDAGIKRNLAELDARIYMNEGNRRPNVEQMLTRSGVIESGAKANVVAKVTQPADTGKAAKTLADRLGKAKDYAKHAGKASIPAFLGGAAVQALVDGVGWVMDEGGKVTQKPDESYNPQYLWIASGVDSTKSPTLSLACQKYASVLASNGITWVGDYKSASDSRCHFENSSFSALRSDNPSYNPSAPPQETLEVTQEQLTEALKNALDSNNPALAAAIAEAIKAAYSYDGSEGQDNSTSTIAIGTANDMNEVVDRAFDNPTPNATSDKPSGYYKIKDGEKTVEGYVYPTEPTGSITPQPDTGTGTEPGTGTGTGTGTSTGGATFELPAFCEWAGIVCDFIEWYKTQPEDDSPELPEHELEKKEIDKELLNVSGSSCPQDLTVNWTGLPFGITINESFEMQPYCNELEPLKYVFILITTCLCAFMFVRL
ncbi:virulence factor TspB C-terminal domain-related protein [Acinetobacter johnsonii]|uniref:virulence factor TspB C-terminal domain-related protein n=1 Tax=Acinetobacter johnsonii TaxID=40214 RepID=UPI001D0E8593|nr:virulence factor TspB C-terminal domain-related protein [Acinetobacter johnsonii]